MKNNDLLVVNEVAEVLRLSKFRVYQLLQEGIIKGFRVGNGGSWRISKKDLLEYIKNINK
ncbi:MAG: helix-turn-helix domain-containing protein [Candidatus Woesearchaeota archaeon]